MNIVRAPPEMPVSIPGLTLPDQGILLTAPGSSSQGVLLKEYGHHADAYALSAPRPGPMSSGARGLTCTRTLAATVTHRDGRS